jgi:N-acetyl-anhydromuramyl-L-alanine amidase AmpD
MSRPGAEVERAGDEVMVAGRMFHTGTRVVLWTDPGGYDAYRTEKRFAPWNESAFVVPQKGTPAPEGQPARPERYGMRDRVLTWPELDRVRGGGWPLELLQQKIDQFVIHFDAVGTSKFCFQTLQDQRALSVHFMLDIDGTIYQTLDVKERAFHATTSNYRSVGIEIANRGAYETDIPLKEFYAKDASGPFISLPARFGDGGIMVKGTYRPIRPDLQRAKINGLNLVMYDYTPEQYAALARLTATLCTVLPKITLDYPKDWKGSLILSKLPDPKLEKYQGLLGHYHVQDNKYDPGPAFQWDLLVETTRALMSPEALAANKAWANSPVKMAPTTTPAPPAPTGRGAVHGAGAP